MDKKSPPDLKESFNGGPLKVPKDLADPEAYKFCLQPTPWSDLKEFKDAWQAYYSAMQLFKEKLMRVFAEALGLEREYFNPLIKNPISALRAIYYLSTRKHNGLEQQRAGAIRIMDP